ncbi:type II toxin-antitoxin system ParD family antitoxin [uncultured Algimonas sp.]|uniref:ribbon-helix-helix domain-containing protein n=1 Tax=uncultured Algimonas sp. TaxID=1547920 RepID=UPI00344F3C61
MSRQSVTFTDANDKWLQTQVAKGEYSSKSDVINDLVRQERRRERRIDWIRAELDKGYESGISERSPSEIWEDVKARHHRRAG